jgi:hypothetical protein
MSHIMSKETWVTDVKFSLSICEVYRYKRMCENLFVTDSS